MATRNEMPNKKAVKSTVRTAAVIEATTTARRGQGVRIDRRG